MPRTTKPDRYWTDVHEQAVIAFLQAPTIEEKNKIYSDVLHKPIVKMSQGVFGKYFFEQNYLGSEKIQELLFDGVTFAFIQLSKFNPTKGKAFSFIQTVIKNRFHDKITFVSNPDKVILESLSISSVDSFEEDYEHVLKLYAEEEPEESSLPENRAKAIKHLSSLIKRTTSEEILQVLLALRELVSDTKLKEWDRSFLTLYLIKSVDLPPERIFAILKQQELSGLVLRIEYRERLEIEKYVRLPLNQSTIETLRQLEYKDSLNAVEEIRTKKKEYNEKLRGPKGKRKKKTKFKAEEISGRMG